MTVHTLDVLGEMCPIPILKAQKLLKTIADSDAVLVITDHSCVEANLRSVLSARGYVFQSEEVVNGIWHITISKNR